MSKTNNIPLKNILEDDEDIFWEKRPNKTAYLINSCKDEVPKFAFDILFKCFLIPLLFSRVYDTLSSAAILISITLWILYLLPTLQMLKIPFLKLKEYKNTYYIVTNQAIYIQFGVDQIYYRKYPNDRIGTRVFYRANKIDNIFGVGTLGFSVDDYYEERFVSIPDYESLYNTLKVLTNSRREELAKIQEERQAKKREFEEQAKLLAQEKLFEAQQEEDDKIKREENYRRELEEQQRRHEEWMRQREEERRRERERRREENEESFNSFRERRREMQEMQEREEENNESYDMYGDGIEMTDRPPSEKTISNYRAKRQGQPSSAAYSRSSVARRGKHSIKANNPDPNAPAEAEQPVNAKLNMSKLWNNSDDDE